MAKELGKSLFRGCLHRRVDEELNPMVDPHAPLPLSNRPRQDWLEVNPIRVDPFVDVGIWFDPVAVDIPRIRLFGAEAAVNVNLFNARRPKRFDGGLESSQKPSTPRRETKTLCYFRKSRLIIARRQRPGLRVERWNQAIFIISDIGAIVNRIAVKCK